MVLWPKRGVLPHLNDSHFCFIFNKLRLRKRWRFWDKSTMSISKFKLLFPLIILFVGGAVSTSTNINVTRSTNDTFTNPNHTAVDRCKSNATVPPFFDTCKMCDSVNTQAVRIRRRICCEFCRYRSCYPTCLAHLRKLSADVVGQKSKGRSSEWFLLLLLYSPVPRSLMIFASAAAKYSKGKL